MTRTLIIGGGAIGLSLAYHLGQRGAGEVALLERNSLTSGTSWHAAGIVGPLRATPNMTRLASHALDLFPKLERDTGMATGYRRTGGYWLARAPDRMDELHRIADLGVTQGLKPRILAPDQIDLPLIDRRGLVGALQVPEDGNVNPVDLCMAYARAATAAGVMIREGQTVARILTRGEAACGVALADGREILADRVVICAGAWSKRLAGTAGLALPLQPVEHMYVVTEPMPGLPDPMPVLRDLDRGIYIKGDAGKLVVGGFEPDAKCWDPHGPEGDRPFLELPEDWEQFAPFMQTALDLVPRLQTAGIQHFMNGPESFTYDTRPLVGPAPGIDGLYVAAGMNSVGVMSSAGIGRALADWIVDGHAPFDLWEVDVARADPATAQADRMAARMKEAVADLFALHWPYKQPRHGRGAPRDAALHDRWLAAGAHVGMTADWHRGLWYADTPGECALPYATGAQPWWPLAAREAGRMDQGAVLLDLTPMTKIRVTGPDTYAALNWLSCRALTPDHRVHYAPCLNNRGGIELDATVQTLDPQTARIVTPAATRFRDLGWLRRACRGFDVRLNDQTEQFAILGLMGAGSRDLLQSLTATDLSDKDHGSVFDVTLAGHKVLAQRLSFVGELGYELWVWRKDGPPPAAVFDALSHAGACPMGHLALDGCRIEKGFRHWGHEIGPTVTPLEAGLGFTVDWTKDFLGKDALERQRAQGLTRRIVMLQVAGAPLLLHDEPVYEGARHVGFTTSGARGPRTGLDLAMAMIQIDPGEPLTRTCARDLHVRVAGRDHPARVLRRAPFDPDGTRMQA